MRAKVNVHEGNVWWASIRVLLQVLKIEMEVPTRAELQKLKVVDLRKRLTKLSLPISGESGQPQ